MPWPLASKEVTAVASSVTELSSVTAGCEAKRMAKFQSGVTIGVKLGLSNGTARAMMRQQLAANASDSAADSRYLVPPGGSNGGADDLDPGSDEFP